MKIKLPAGQKRVTAALLLALSLLLTAFAVFAAVTQHTVDRLKAELAATDYQIIKCSECQLLGQPMPYDVAELHAQRQAIRDEINALEE